MATSNLTRLQTAIPLGLTNGLGSGQKGVAVLGLIDARLRLRAPDADLAALKIQLEKPATRALDWSAKSSVRSCYPTLALR